MLRDTDHAAVYSFLRTLETKGVPGGFSGYGGQSFSGAYGNSMYPFVNQMLPGAQYDYEREAGDTWRNGAVAIAMGWFERNFPEPRMHVWTGRGADRREIEDHQAVQTLENPNDFYDGDTLWMGTLISWFVDGNAYWLKGQTADRVHTRQFWWVPHWQVFPRWPEDGSTFISHYDYVRDGKITKLRTDQVVHFRNGIDPNNYRYGWSKLKAQLREVCTDNEASGFAASLCRNMGVPGFAIMPEEKEDYIEKDQRDEIKDQWREEFTGEGRGGLLVGSGRFKLEKITLTPEELTLDKIRKIPEARIAASIGLHPQVLGLTTGEGSKTFSNYGEARESGYEDCLRPTQRQLARQFRRQVPELFRNGEFFGWCYDDVPAMQGDLNAKAKRAVVLFQGSLATRNEGRAIVKLPPTTDQGDKFHEGKQLSGSEPTIGNNRMGGKDE